MAVNFFYNARHKENPFLSNNFYFPFSKFLNSQSASTDRRLRFETWVEKRRLVRYYMTFLVIDAIR